MIGHIVGVAAALIIAAALSIVLLLFVAYGNGIIA